jgi:hypothetical protein
MVLIPNRTATKNKNVTVRIVVAIVDKNNTTRKQTDAAANGKINYTWEYFIYSLGHSVSIFNDIVSAI